MSGVTNKPQIEAFIGMTGSGKGVSINRRLAELKPTRLLIWDPRDEYAKHAPALHSIAKLIELAKRRGSGPLRIRFVPQGGADLKEEFGKVCRIAFALGALVFLAEELSDVTTPSWAPPGWKTINTQGRHKGLHVLGAAQRPALIDKNFLGNCTRVRCFMLGYDEDEQTMAKALRAPLGLVQGLVTADHPDEKGADIKFLEYERRTRTLLCGELTVREGQGVTNYRTAPYVVDTPQKTTRKPRAKAAAT